MKQIRKNGIDKVVGFTLIELLIVLAILGILSAIAIPQYQNYLSRSRWADNIQSLANVKTPIAECLQNNANNATLCDTLVKLTAGGYTDLAALPQPNYAAAPVTITAATAAIVTVGTAQVGGCTVTTTPVITTGQVRFTSVTTVAAGCDKASTGF